MLSVLECDTGAPGHGAKRVFGYVERNVYLLCEPLGKASEQGSASGKEYAGSPGAAASPVQDGRTDCFFHRKSAPGPASLHAKTRTCPQRSYVLSARG